VARPRQSSHPSTRLARALAGALLVTACAHPPPDAGEATLVEVIDGDTITVQIGPHTEDVRLLGVDTPETKHPTRPVECFGPEASAFTTDLLPPGTRLLLERDTEPRDTYGRLLAYVRRADDDLFVNLELVRHGYADVLVIAPNEAYAPTLRAAVATAEEQRQGLWGACGSADVPATGASEAGGQAVPSPP
jgi:micrococcal nuclease